MAILLTHPPQPSQLTVAVRCHRILVAENAVAAAMAEVHAAKQEAVNAGMSLVALRAAVRALMSRSPLALSAEASEIVAAVRAIPIGDVSIEGADDGALSPTPDPRNPSLQHDAEAQAA